MRGQRGREQQVGDREALSHDELTTATANTMPKIPNADRFREPPARDGPTDAGDLRQAPGGERQRQPPSGGCLEPRPRVHGKAGTREQIRSSSTARSVPTPIAVR